MRLGRGEDNSHSLNDQFGRVSSLQKSILLFEGPKPSFYRGKDQS